MFITLAVVLATLPTTVFASAGAGGGLPYEGWLGQLRASVTGPVAFTLAIIGIVGAGGALIFGGELNAFLRSIIFLVLVMAFLVGAQNMMSSMFGQGATVAMSGDLRAARPHAALEIPSAGVALVAG
jgi:type IV secretion system protein VirB2